MGMDLVCCQFHSGTISEVQKHVPSIINSCNIASRIHANSLGPSDCKVNGLCRGRGSQHSLFLDVASFKAPMQRYDGTNVKSRVWRSPVPRGEWSVPILHALMLDVFLQILISLRFCFIMSLRLFQPVFLQVLALAWKLTWCWIWV